VVSSCEHGSEHSGFIKGENQFSHYQILQEQPTKWSQLFLYLRPSSATASVAGNINRNMNIILNGNTTEEAEGYKNYAKQTTEFVSTPILKSF
jgi:hypothetical protein